MQKILSRVAKYLYLAATLALFLLALGFVIYAGWRVATALIDGAAVLPAMLSAVGLTIIALAVCDVGRFLLQEELAGEDELATTSEVRRTLTKFLTIIIVAASLHGLLFIFEAGHEDIATLVYPAILLAVVALLLATLGAYQRLTHSAEHERRVDAQAGRPVEPEDAHATDKKDDA
jgi:hypothetical protein